MRDYEITDEGESIDFALFEDGVQVGAGMFPLDVMSSIDAMNAAASVGMAFVSAGSRNVTVSLLH